MDKTEPCVAVFSRSEGSLILFALRYLERAIESDDVEAADGRSTESAQKAITDAIAPSLPTSDVPPPSPEERPQLPRKDDPGPPYDSRDPEERAVEVLIKPGRYGDSQGAARLEAGARMSHQVIGVCCRLSSRDGVE